MRKINKSGTWSITLSFCVRGSLHLSEMYLSPENRYVFHLHRQLKFSTPTEDEMLVLSFWKS